MGNGRSRLSSRRCLGAKVTVNDNLQQQLKLLYDYWFVQFDFPDETGKPYRSSGGEMVWNETLKKNIPANWITANLYHIADYINGLACQKYRPHDGESSLPVIKIKEMHEGITSSTEKVSANIPEQHIVLPGDILFSWSASLEVMRWLGCKGGLNQHIFKVRPKSYFTSEYVYLQLSEYVSRFIQIAEARKTTMGHITADHLQDSCIAIPPKCVIEKFSQLVIPMYKAWKTYYIEIEQLKKARDDLLVVLMNGQAAIVD